MKTDDDNNNNNNNSNNNVTKATKLIRPVAKMIYHMIWYTYMVLENNSNRHWWRKGQKLINTNTNNNNKTNTKHK